MKEELKTILDNIVADLRSQGHDPVDRPIVFVWDYGGDIKYTLVFQAISEDDVVQPAELH